MLTAKMEVDEVMREVMQDVRWTEGWYEMNMRMLIKEILRSGHIPCTAVRQVTSPVTRNVWTLMLTIPSMQKPLPMCVRYTTLQDEDGVYVYQPIQSGDGMRLLVFMPHFFRRYRERMALGDKLKTHQLIRRYMKLNRDGTFKAVGRHKGYTSWAICTEEGVTLGGFCTELCFLCKTFITHDMLRDGRQAREVWNGEEERQNLKLKFRSVREYIRLANEAEHLTSEEEQQRREHDKKTIKEE